MKMSSVTIAHNIITGQSGSGAGHSWKNVDIRYGAYSHHLLRLPGLHACQKWEEFIPRQQYRANVGPTSGRQYRHWPNVEPTYVAVWVVTVCSLAQLRSTGIGERHATFQYTLPDERPSTGTWLVTLIDILTIVITIKYLDRRILLIAMYVNGDRNCYMHIHIHIHGGNISLKTLFEMFTNDITAMEC